MDMNLEHFHFMAWYPAEAVINESVTTRRVHKWFVDMRPNTRSRYTVITRDETEQELQQRIVDEAEIEAYIEKELRENG